MSKHVPPPTGTPIAGPEVAQDSFAALAAAVCPAWHQAILRLANVAQRVANQLEWVCSHPQDNDPESTYAGHCRELVDSLLEFLDGLDEDPDLEPTLGYMNGPAEMDECETPEDGEPSLASLDRMADQTKWAAGGMMDAELDESDDEPSLGSGATFSSSSQAHWAQGASDEREDMNENGDGSWANGTVDDEPSLGSTASLNQEKWSAGDGNDREQGTTRRFREEPKPVSICNVTPIPGAE
jgi:hypothetical protein